MSNTELSLEKLKINERLGILETKLDSLSVHITGNLNKLNEIIIGNGEPQKGHSFRIVKLEESEEKRKGHMAWIVGTVGLGISTFLADIAHRIFFHHK